MSKERSSEVADALVFDDDRLDILAGADLPPALRRLVEEVRDERAAGDRGVAPHRYDRIHNRHNRS